MISLWYCDITIASLPWEQGREAINESTVTDRNNCGACCTNFFSTLRLARFEFVLLSSRSQWIMHVLGGNLCSSDDWKQESQIIYSFYLKDSKIFTVWSHNKGPRETPSIHRISGNAYERYCSESTVAVCLKLCERTSCTGSLWECNTHALQEEGVKVLVFKAKTPQRNAHLNNACERTEKLTNNS